MLKQGQEQKIMLKMNDFIIGIAILGIALIVIPIIACHSPDKIELIDKDKSE